MNPGSTERQALEEGELLAAIDLGSNSYHMVVARHTLGQLRVIDRLRKTVRMAAGLDEHGGLDPAALNRALDCLARFGERIQTMPSHRVRAIATNTVRALRSPQSFLLPAETALGHGIEVVSGREEARLIYLGVAQGLPPQSKQRLVIDVGGGSTEFIIGKGLETMERESLQMGCVASTRRFFGDGKLSRKRWKDGLTEISAEFQQFAAAYRERGWQEVIGSSGTIKAVGQILAGMKVVRGAVTDTGIAQVRDALLEFERIEDIRLPGLSDERRPVMPGGLLVLEACFNELGVKRMQVCQTAMREGVLYDMLGRALQRDPRDTSIEALAQRYGVDLDQAQRIEETALHLFDQIAPDWQLEPDERLMLGWAARIHEVGLTIAHSQHQVHGAYLIEHSDIAGFSRQEQQLLAAMVRCHRRSIPSNVMSALPERITPSAQRLTMLLRLSAVLHRSHGRTALPEMKLRAGDKGLQLLLPRAWLDSHPLSREDLETERGYLAQIGLKLAIRSI